MPRLLRARTKALLDPGDFFLWLAEELNDDAYDEWLTLWATPIGIGVNVAFILARGAGRRGVGRDDGVFGDDGSSSGWFAWLCTFVVQFLALACCFNACYTFFRKRHYRLFEQPVDLPPATPSARLVRVDSSPSSASPWYYLQKVIRSSTAFSRAHPDAEREVWELSVWDPKSFNLAIFTLFSPGHLLNYYLLLPPASMDSRPSVTVATSIAFSVLLSLQLWFVTSSFSQQAKDARLVHGEVMNEYDTKFVHPFLNQPVRDVGIQTRESAISPRGTKTREVDIYTPTTIVKRGFRTNPNPNYSRQYDPENLAAQPSESRRTYASNNSILETPSNGYTDAQTQSTFARPTSTAPDFSSPLKSHHERLRARSPMKGDGGSMGVHSHAASPLRKVASSNHIRARRDGADDTNRPGSALKRVSTPGNAYGPGRRRETGRF